MTTDGILVVNKPSGRTSRWATDRARKIFSEKKAGHLGTLDPLASGVLPVALGRATRLIRYLEGGDKLYRAGIRLGIVTDTYDLAGTVTSTGDCSAVSDDALGRVAASFVGRVMQRPPAFSALKRDGVPLYKLARRGDTVEPPAREVEIFSVTVEQFERPELTLLVHCGSGVYIRSIAHDLGQLLGCGATLASLVRLRSGGHSLERAVDLEADEADLRAGLIPLVDCLPGTPALPVDRESAGAIIDGKTIPAEAPPGSLIRLIYDGSLLAVAEVIEGELGLRLAPRTVVMGKDRL